MVFGLVISSGSTLAMSWKTGKRGIFQNRHPDQPEAGKEIQTGISDDCL
tara:strand:+ start:504 stop:650 length:147 start_codon:yes stop_codon:yes gene_type:complete